MSKFSKLVYFLIYPGILGSMMYEIIPNEFELISDNWNEYMVLIFILKISILLFYIIDYWHLYFIMEENYTDKAKSKISYIVFDLLVCVFLLGAMKSIEGDSRLTLFFVGLTPLLFFGYYIFLFLNKNASENTNYNNGSGFRIKFYSIYGIVSAILTLTLLNYIQFAEESLVNLYALTSFTTISMITYFLFVKNQNQYSSNNHTRTR